MANAKTSGVSRRRVLQVGGALAGAAALGATPRRALAQTKTLRVLVAGDPFYYALDGLKDQFKEETGIEAQIESISLEALQARLTSSFISNQRDADVISVDQMWLGQYLESKWILPLNELHQGGLRHRHQGLHPAGPLFDEHVARPLGTLPVAAYGQCVLYRKDFADASGFKIPEDGSWSWADYVTMIKAMNGKEFERHQDDRYGRRGSADRAGRAHVHAARRQHGHALVQEFPLECLGLRSDDQFARRP